MSVANGLTTYVHITDDTAMPHVFGPDDDLPDWAAERIGPHCFEGGVKPSKSTRKSSSTGRESAGG